MTLIQQGATSVIVEVMGPGSSAGMTAAGVTRA
jgi:hypothetical protein